MTSNTERQNQALETGKSICVTAGAGTGKTYILTQRYLKLLKNGVLPRDIVALTYTEKAAAEMQTKIGRELKQQADTCPELKESWETFSQANISTFHGFCLAILKEFAYEAGLDPGFSVMDELDKAELIERTITNVLEKPPEELFDAVVRLHAYHNTRDLKRAVRIFAQAPGGWLEKLRTEPEAVRREWVAAYCRYLSEKGVDTRAEFFSLLQTETEEDCLSYLKNWFFTDPVNSGIISRIENYPELDELSRGWTSSYITLIGKLPTAQSTEEIREIAGKVAKSTAKIQSSKKFPLTGAETETVREFCEIVKSLSFLPGKDGPAFTLTRSLLLDFAAAAAYCREKISAEKQRAGVLDFDDLLDKTADLLSDKNPEILETVSKRFSYVLVDEVQDNDPKLISLVKKLCGDPKKSDRLFIVGDAKQSIYRFRNADVAGYMELQREFPEEPVALDTSFRSAPAIINLVNRLFAKIFANPTKPWEPAYDPITPFRTEAEGSVELIRIPYTSDSKALTDLESDAVASWIYDAVSVRKIPVAKADGTMHAACYSDVAVLLEKRNSLPALTRALDRYGIPYDELSGKSFYSKQETADLKNLLSAVLYPEEDVSLYGALRSPYFAIPDAELERAAYGESGTLSARLKRFAKENPESRTASALQTLSRWREYAKSQTPSAALERMVCESGILSVYAAAFGGARMAGNLRKLLDILQSKTEVKPFSLYEFAELLETSMEGELQEADGEPADDAGDRVKILTVHASKGLEYPIVCTAYSGAPRRTWAPDVVMHDTLGFGVSVKPVGEKSVNILRTLLSDEENAKEEADQKRLFYVALTRARDHLLISGSVNNKNGVAAKSFLSLYEGAAEDEEIVCYTEKLCEPEAQCPVEPYSAGDAKGTAVPASEEEIISLQNESDAALARGTRLHAVFAGEADDAEFREQYAAFLRCPLMEDVVFERCEMPVMSPEGRKVIDRFVQYADGSYAVIDYKTGSISAAKANGWFAGYESQVKEYVRLMKEVVGAEVSGWLYFADEEEEKRIWRV